MEGPRAYNLMALRFLGKVAHSRPSRSPTPSQGCVDAGVPCCTAELLRVKAIAWWDRCRELCRSTCACLTEIAISVPAKDRQVGILMRFGRPVFDSLSLSLFSTKSPTGCVFNRSAALGEFDLQQPHFCAGAKTINPLRQPITSPKSLESARMPRVGGPPRGHRARIARDLDPGSASGGGQSSVEAFAAASVMLVGHELTTFNRGFKPPRGTKLRLLIMPNR
jgi:hypothetical protein